MTKRLNISGPLHFAPAHSCPPIQTSFLHSPDSRRKRALASEGLSPVMTVATFSKAASFPWGSGAQDIMYEPVELSSPSPGKKGLYHQASRERWARAELRGWREKGSGTWNRLRSPYKVSSRFRKKLPQEAPVKPKDTVVDKLTPVV